MLKIFKFIRIIRVITSNFTGNILKNYFDKRFLLLYDKKILRSIIYTNFGFIQKDFMDLNFKYLRFLL